MGGCYTIGSGWMLHYREWVESYGEWVDVAL